jgi:hypothetical protein
MNVASGLLSRPGHFLHWGVVQISLANLLVIIVMIILFVLALVIPFPHGRRDADESRDDDERA